MYIYMCVCACVRARARLHDIYIERERERERGGETEQNIAQFSPVAAYHYVIKISRIALKSMIFLAMSYFYTLPHKGTFKKKTEYETRVLVFTTFFGRIIYCKKG